MHWKKGWSSDACEARNSPKVLVGETTIWASDPGFSFAVPIYSLLLPRSHLSVWSMCHYLSNSAQDSPFSSAPGLWSFNIFHYSFFLVKSKWRGKVSPPQRPVISFSKACFIPLHPKHDMNKINSPQTLFPFCIHTRVTADPNNGNNLMNYCGTPGNILGSWYLLFLIPTKTLQVIILKMKKTNIKMLIV